MTNLILALLLAAPAQFITYEQFGAKADGVTDDMPAIIAAHKAANEKGLPVRAQGTYFIAAKARTAVIRTDVDWTGAEFVIDDVGLDRIDKNLFEVESYEKPFEIEGVWSLRKGQKNLGVKLPCDALVMVENANHPIYIRKGLNQDNGTPQREALLVSKSGRIAADSPVMWDYEAVTSAKAWPVDRKRLTIRGGKFTTIANQQESKYRYHARGIDVRRSNVVVEGITHFVEGELDHGAPYRAFIYVSNAADVEVRDCLLTPHKTYTTIGSAGKPVKMGSYDLGAVYCVNVRWVRCTQTRSIDDTAYWGLFASNFCKDLRMEDCTMSRFDAHMGVYGVTLRRCTFGHMGVRFVGMGKALLEDCEIRYNSLVALRGDYGSSWDGEITARRCTRKAPGYYKGVDLISGANNEDHDFGYVCHLPRKVVIDGLLIDDSGISFERYGGPCVFATFGRKYGKPGPYPMVAQGSVKVKDVRTTSGRALAICLRPELFEGYEVSGL